MQQHTGYHNHRPVFNAPRYVVALQVSLGGPVHAKGRNVETLPRTYKKESSMNTNQILVDSRGQLRPFSPQQQSPKQQEPAITYDSTTFMDVYGNSLKKQHAEANGITSTHWLFAIGGLLLGGYLGYRLGRG